ncbi:hypothetical protein F2P56_006054, partial [Juglans regia]
ISLSLPEKRRGVRSLGGREGSRWEKRFDLPSPSSSLSHATLPPSIHFSPTPLLPSPFLKISPHFLIYLWAFRSLTHSPISSPSLQILSISFPETQNFSGDQSQFHYRKIRFLLDLALFPSNSQTHFADA